MYSFSYLELVMVIVIINNTFLPYEKNIKLVSWKDYHDVYSRGGKIIFSLPFWAIDMTHPLATL